MFYINLKSNLENKQIYKVKYLLQCNIIFKAPISKQDIPQRTNYQRYGHTKKFCHRSSRCVKCVKDSHATVDCSRKERSVNIKYVLCDRNHPANYKSSAVFKEIQRTPSFKGVFRFSNLKRYKFPALRNKQNFSKQGKAKQEVPTANVSGSQVHASTYISMPKLLKK